MKFLIDNNLSFKLVKNLDSKNIDAIHVKDALSVHAYDIDIWEFAKKKGMTILTKDNDFDELSQLYGCPPKVKVRLFSLLRKIRTIVC